MRFSSCVLVLCALVAACRSEGLTGPEYGAAGSSPGVGPRLGDGGADGAPITSIDAGTVIVDLSRPADLATPKKSCSSSGNTCNTATEVCVIEVGFAEDEGECRPVPAACGSLNARNCDCLDQLCTGTYWLCSDTNQPNTIHCECPNC